MNAIIGSILSSVLGKYIEPEGLKSINISFGGEIKLRSLAVKPEALDQIDLPFKIRHGTVGAITVAIPGGLTGFLSRVYTEPIRIRIDDVHILIDKAPQTPGELARKRAVQQQAALDLDAVAYRQQLLELLEAEAAKLAAASGASGPGTSGGGGRAGKGSLQDAVLRNLQIEINGFHLRYEDARSQADAPFALGVTFASFSTYSRQDSLAEAPPLTSGSSATELASAGAQPSVPGVMYRSARLSLACVYLDPLSLDGEFNKLSSSLRDLAFSRGVPTKENAPKHHFLLAPTSPVLQLALNLDGKAPAEPAVRASLVLSQLRLVATRRQVTALLFLQAWLEEDRFPPGRQGAAGEEPAACVRAAGPPGLVALLKRLTDFFRKLY